MRSLGRLSRTDLAYTALITLLIALLALSSLLGQPFAALTLPFSIGGAVGYALARLATSAQAPEWARSAALISAAAAFVLEALLLSFLFTSIDLFQPLTALTDFENYSVGAFLLRLLAGFGIIYLSEVFRRICFPMLFPQTSEDADRQTRERMRGVMVVGGILLGLALLAAAAFGVLALIAHLVAVLNG